MQSDFFFITFAHAVKIFMGIHAYIYNCEVVAEACLFPVVMNYILKTQVLRKTQVMLDTNSGFKLCSGFEAKKSFDVKSV